jgi:hypothetical protein
MTPLPPAAQVVWDAWNDAYEAQGPLEDMGQPIAAALRAAADQVVPMEKKPVEPPGYAIGYEPPEYLQDWTRWHVRRHVRAQLLAIAAELEGQ